MRTKQDGIGHRGGSPAPRRESPRARRGRSVVSAGLESIWLSCLLVPGSLAAVPTMSVDELRPGMRGSMQTVLQGTELERLEVEILGVQKNGIGPGVPLILGRLTDARGQWVGVASGMSGSPVEVDGKLIGALSYVIGSFGKEPICGITPIETMLALESYPEGQLPWLADASSQTDSVTVPLAIAASGPSLGPLGGAGESIGELLAKTRIERLQALPITARAADRPAGEPDSTAAELRPGSAVAVLMVWGDLVFGATGTVSWRDGDELLAFGHPFFGIGRIEAPIAPAEIIWTVPSNLNSFKIANIGEPVGSLIQDRLTAVKGRLGPTPRGLPISMTVRRPGRPDRKLDFEIVRDPEFAPLLADIGLRQGIAIAIGAERSEALRMRATLYLAGGRELPVRAEGSGEAGDSPPRALGTQLAMGLAAVMQAPFELPAPERIEIEITGVEPDGELRITRAMPDRIAVRQGESLRVHVDLEGSRGQHSRRALDLVVPADAPAGEYVAIVGGSERLRGELGAIEEARRRTARTADEYLAAIADDASAATLELRLMRAAEGMVAGGREYPALPSNAHLLMRSRPGGAELYRARWLVIASVTSDLPRPVGNVATAKLTILPKERPE